MFCGTVNFKKSVPGLSDDSFKLEMGKPDTGRILLGFWWADNGWTGWGGGSMWKGIHELEVAPEWSQHRSGGSQYCICQKLICASLLECCFSIFTQLAPFQPCFLSVSPSPSLIQWHPHLRDFLALLLLKVPWVCSGQYGSQWRSWRWLYIEPPVYMWWVVGGNVSSHKIIFYGHLWLHLEST